MNIFTLLLTATALLYCLFVIITATVKYCTGKEIELTGLARRVLVGAVLTIPDLNVLLLAAATFIGAGFGIVYLCFVAGPTYARRREKKWQR